MICDEEELMLIVGRQVRNEKNGRSDLTTVDNKGNIVLIEIKRDRKDIEHRKEAFEFQAIGFAVSYATIDKIDNLVKKVYALYIEKYRSEFESGELTSFELGIRKLNEFLRVNDAGKKFNEKQRIILVASDYENEARNLLIKALSENSTGKAKSLVSGYISHIRRIRLFLVSGKTANSLLRPKK